MSFSHMHSALYLTAWAFMFRGNISSAFLSFLKSEEFAILFIIFFGFPARPLFGSMPRALPPSYGCSWRGTQLWDLKDHKPNRLKTFSQPFLLIIRNKFGSRKDSVTGFSTLFGYTKHVIICHLCQPTKKHLIFGTDNKMLFCYVILEIWNQHRNQHNKFQMIPNMPVKSINITNQYSCFF